MSSKLIQSLQKATRPLVFGMIHVPALPGTPLSTLKISQIDEIVRSEAEIYSKTSVDGVIVENMHDIPYTLSSEIEAEIVASMTRLALTVSKTFSDQKKKSLFGLQILAGANKQALAVAMASGFDFIRAESFVFGHVGDEGYMDACAGPLLRYRKAIGAESVAVITDIKKKHSSHAITSDLSITEIAHAAEFFLADGVIVTGSSTGKAANVSELQAVKKNGSLPVFVGSGVTVDNVGEYMQADGLIIGSHFKKNDDWRQGLEADKINAFMDTLRSSGMGNVPRQRPSNNA